MIIHVKVKPNSLKDDIVKLDDGNYLIHTSAKALDGRANISVVKMLAKEFGVNFRNVLIKNPKSRNKIIEIIK